MDTFLASPVPRTKNIFPWAFSAIGIPVAKSRILPQRQCGLDEHHETYTMVKNGEMMEVYKAARAEKSSPLFDEIAGET